MTDEEPVKVPKQWEYTKSFYKELSERATPIMIEGEEVMRYEGHVSVLFKEVCPKGNYKFVTDNLERLGCISINRGGGPAPTTVYLWGDPETALENPLPVRMEDRIPSTTDGKFRAMHQRIADLEREAVNTNRRLEMLEGKPINMPYEPGPPIHNRQAPREQLQGLVDFAEGLEEKGGS